VELETEKECAPTLPDDVEALKTLIREQATEITSLKDALAAEKKEVKRMKNAWAHGR
jgi:hypothetical protein